MRDFSIEDGRGQTQAFDRILIPYNTLYALGGRDEVLACLRRAAAHLGTQGEIWCDVYPVDEMHEAVSAGEELPPDDDEPVLEMSLGGTDVFVVESTDIDPDAQHLDVVYRAISASGSEVSRLIMAHDYLTSADLETLFQEANLEVFAHFGGFSGESVDDPEQLIWGVRHAR
jgi:hypothetical protein